MTKLSNLHLTNFKNYADTSLIFHDRLNAFIGLNGMGKTNLLDAIYFLSLARSHFTHRDRLLIKEGEAFFRIDSTFKRGDREDRLVIKYPHKRKKVIEWNGAPVEKMSDHVGRLPVVFFAPDDEKMVYGGSVERRKLIDTTIAQYDRNYLQKLGTYNKLLKHRNRLLNQDHIDHDLLDTIDIQMSVLGDEIYSLRSDFLTDYAQDVASQYEKLSGGKEAITVSLTSKLENQPMLDLVRQARPLDLVSKRSSVGIHKDDLIFLMDSKAFKLFGSQGQVKSLLLSLRIAQINTLKRKKEFQPILIIDDIFDKLDEQRIAHLLKVIEEYGTGQTFISYTNKSRLAQFLKQTSLSYKIFHIQNGTIINETTS